MIAWAEVIGDPIAHSLSPSIHRFWLETLGIAGRYEATHVRAPDLASFVAHRRADQEWRGCNVTAPHKETVAGLVDRTDEAASAVGAVNCVYRDDGGLAGTNTGLDGVAEALQDVPLRGARVAVIGGGGGARAALHYLRGQGAEVLLVLRNPQKAQALQAGAVGFEDAGRAFRSATLLVNATPLGLAGGEGMPGELLAAVRNAGAVAAFDMVYRPLETGFLAAAREGGARPIDGLAMLIGQARRAFTLFFGAQPPAGTDAELRRRLTLGQ